MDNNSILQHLSIVVAVFFLSYTMPPKRRRTSLAIDSIPAATTITPGTAPTTMEQPPTKRARTQAPPTRYTPAHLPVEMIQHIGTFAPPTTTLYRQIAGSQVPMNIRTLYGYRSSDPSRTHVMLPMTFRLASIRVNDLVLLAQVIAASDYDRVVIEELVLDPEDMEIVPLDHLTLQRSIPFFARIRTLTIDHTIPEWLFLYLPYFVRLSVLNLRNLVHSRDNITRAYVLFTIPAFSTLPLEKLTLDVPWMPSGFYVGENAPGVLPPWNIVPRQCFLIPTNVGLTAPVTMTTTIQAPLSPSGRVHCGLFGAIVTAMARNRGIYMLQLRNMVIPQWDQLDTDVYGLFPWESLQKLELHNATDMSDIMRAFFLTQLPMLQVYNESSDRPLLIAEATKQALRNTRVQNVSIEAELSNTHYDILHNLFHLYKLTLLRWRYEQRFDFQVNDLFEEDVEDEEDEEDKEEEQKEIDRVRERRRRIVLDYEKNLERHIRIAARNAQRTVIAVVMEREVQSFNYMAWHISVSLS